VRRDAGKLALRVGADEHELDVDVQRGDRLRAADVARVRVQEPLESFAAVHGVLDGSGLMYPLAASDRRNLRRESKSDL
jgi:hypothetical protein